MYFERKPAFLASQGSFFLFGARGTGKSTLLEERFRSPSVLWIDLLLPEEEGRFLARPDLLRELIEQHKPSCVVIDEVQKLPKLLDLVHYAREKYKNIKFIVTGSSSRKLKRGAANLLAGRLFNFNLHPLTHLEMGSHFLMDDVLHWGSLPAVQAQPDQAERRRYLKSYVQTYLTEEVLAEQLVRKIKPFKSFIPLVAQHSGGRLNFKSIADRLGVDYTTVQNYFEILVDTNFGFYLPSFNRSMAKQQVQAAKFYLFDTGVLRAMNLQLASPLQTGSYEYGRLFEHFIVLEALRLNDYNETDLRFSYFMDNANNEIDLIVQPPQGKEILVEIKSTTEVTEKHTKTLEKFLTRWDRPVEAQIWSQDKFDRQINNTRCLYWRRALGELFS